MEELLDRDALATERAQLRYVLVNVVVQGELAVGGEKQHSGGGELLGKRRRGDRCRVGHRCAVLNVRTAIAAGEDDLPRAIDSDRTSWPAAVGSDERRE